MAPRGDKRANARDTAPHTLAEVQKRVEHVIPAAFDQAQSSAATHQKNWVALHKLHAQASEVDYGLPEFEQGFIACVQKVLSIKKGAGGGVGERLVKFISGYVKHINEKVGEDAPEEEETYASKFVDTLVNHLLKGFVAKDKIVRYRCVQIMSESVAFLGAIDEDLYRTLRSSFLARTEDKEPPVRVQAVLALGKLLPSDDPQEKGERIVDVVQDILQFDPSGDVRRTALVSLPLSRSTLPTLLTRVRDTDATVRRTLYSAVITRLKPQHLSPEQLARVVNCGLRDREESVKTAAKNLVAGWAGKSAAAVAEGEQHQHQNDKNEAVDLLVDFVALFDLASSLEPVERALECVFEMRRDLLDKVEFAEEYWLTLTPERALLARCFVDYCVKHKDEARMERALPVVTALAFRVQDEVHKLDTAQTEIEDDEDKPAEDVDAEQVFIVGEMLRMSAELDYSDEIGRRKMFALVRDMLSQPSLPDPLLAPCLDVLRVLSASERDLIRVVVEIVHELRDPEDEADAEDVEADLFADEDDDASQASISKPATRPPKEKKKFEDMTPEEQERATAMDLRCLGLCIGMLERVNGSFEENSTLEGILADLIIPAVKRKETLLRERGLIGLGLCCLIAKRMALNSFQLFLGQITSAPEPLKVRVLQIAFDIMMVHEAEFLGQRAVVGEGKMVDFLLHTLENTESDEVQNVLCVGLSKLMLSGMISDERVLKALVLAYLSPQTADNQALRQCLAYFLPVYCFSSSSNQRRMQQIAIPMFSVMNQVRADYGDEPGMISQAQVGEILLGWTNPENLIDVPGMKHDETVHIDLAIDIVQTLFEEEIEVGNKKILCQMLSKVFVPNELDDDKLRKLVVLLSNVKRRRPLGDSTASGHLEKFEKSIQKKFADKLEGVSEEDYRKLEHLNDIFAFLDAIPEAEEEEEPAPKKRATRAKSTAASKTPARSRKKKQSDSDDESDGEGSRATGSRAASPTPTPARAKLARSAAPKKSLAVDLVEDEDEDEEEDDDEDEGENDDDGEEEDEASPEAKDKAKQHSPASASEGAADDDDALSSLSEPDEEDEAEDDDATPVATSKQHGTSEKRGAQAAARTPSNRASKKPRVKSPGPKTPKRNQSHKRVRSDPTATPSPPRKKLKEVTNGRTKRGAAARSREISDDDDESS